MEPVRKPFQGVINIVRFNWHFYAISAIVISIILIIGVVVEGWFETFTVYAIGLIFLGNYISLSASWYIYDHSHLYKFTWLNIDPAEHANILNIHAGFDETSILLKNKYPNSTLTVFDFYDPVKHTEVSIKRARKVYPPYPGTTNVKTNELPVQDQTVDYIFLTLAAHEIRNMDERNAFFKELKRVLKPAGKIILTEHLQDLPNFLVYNIGFMHFATRKSWEENFKQADMVCTKETKITPFISSFILEKNGTTS